jgi:hypothetical protein
VRSPRDGRDGPDPPRPLALLAREQHPQCPLGLAPGQPQPSLRLAQGLGEDRVGVPRHAIDGVEHGRGLVQVAALEQNGREDRCPDHPEDQPAAGLAAELEPHPRIRLRLGEGSAAQSHQGPRRQRQREPARGTRRLDARDRGVDRLLGLRAPIAPEHGGDRDEEKW